ncbi:MAG: zf-HC2 domain-containing protein [Desulfomonile tiedjei]|uniref:Zf-HC2 domain-containing protein n=1 Tax=Desulfomonile tiedjei TaxID=2358 RepID=A0A9D6V3M1_9BACT|nr:zf-HC2 domain-containing protein [Desulfomonile tiedjei]
MKPPEPPQQLVHPDELLLPYIEDSLNPEQRLDVDRHLSSCERCSSEIRELGRITSALRENKQAFCPDSSEVHQFAETGHDPENRISRHLKTCPNCLALAEALGTEQLPHSMPADLWERVQERLGIVETPRVSESVETAPSFAERLQQWFRIPTFAAGAVAAAILLVVILYPRDFTVPGVGLSSVTWEGVSKPKALLPRAAFIITFKDFTEPLPQKSVDEIYRALKPDMELSERFMVISPAELRTAAKSGDILLDPLRIGETVESLNKKLNVSRVAVLTLEASDGKFSVKVELMDAATGTSLGQRRESAIPDNQLPEKIREMVSSMMYAN